MTWKKSKKVIALEARLKDCKNVINLGVRPNFCDYSLKEAGMIRDARKIYYPTTFYAELFDAMGKETFPSYHNYKCVQDKIKQTALFDLLHILERGYFMGSAKKAKFTIILNFHLLPKFLGDRPWGEAYT